MSDGTSARREQLGDMPRCSCRELRLHFWGSVGSRTTEFKWFADVSKKKVLIYFWRHPHNVAFSKAFAEFGPS